MLLSNNSNSFQMLLNFEIFLWGSSRVLCVKLTTLVEMSILWVFSGDESILNWPNIYYFMFIKRDLGWICLINEILKKEVLCQFVEKLPAVLFDTSPASTTVLCTCILACFLRYQLLIEPRVSVILVNGLLLWCVYQWSFCHAHINTSRVCPHLYSAWKHSAYYQF